MNVYKKLQKSRIDLQSVKLTKSGNNKFAGYKYFELGDYLPEIQRIFNENGLCGVISFGKEIANLTIFDTDEPSQSIVIESPMSDAALKGCHAVQNLGAVQTYIRRYLWQTAMEIVEHDAIDSSKPFDSVSIGNILDKISKISSKEDQSECKKIISTLTTTDKKIANEAYIARIDELKAALYLKATNQNKETGEVWE